MAKNIAWREARIEEYKVRIKQHEKEIITLNEELKETKEDAVKSTLTVPLSEVLDIYFNEVTSLKYDIYAAQKSINDLKIRIANHLITIEEIKEAQNDI